MTSMMFAHAVDQALVKLGRVYGPEFTAKHEKLNASELREMWQQELRGVLNALDAITWALSHLPERCPNVRQFVALCNQAPRPHMQAMISDDTQTRPPTVAERDALRALRDDIRAGSLLRKPSKQWAHDLVDKFDRGEYVSQCALRMALEVVEADYIGHTRTPSTIDESKLDADRPQLPENPHDDESERAQADA